MVFRQEDPEARQAKCLTLFQRYSAFAGRVSISPKFTPRTTNLLGVYVWIHSRIGVIPHPLKAQRTLLSCQFLGVHENLVLTYHRPACFDNLVRMSLNVPEIDPFGRVIWLGLTHTRNSCGKRGKLGWRFYISARLWTPPEPYFRKRTVLTGLFHRVCPGGRNPPTLDVIEFPAIKRDLFDLSMT